MKNIKINYMLCYKFCHFMIPYEDKDKRELQHAKRAINKHKRNYH